MKKIQLLVLALVCCTASVFAQNDSTYTKNPWLIGLDLGAAVPMEVKDLHAAGFNGYASFDFAYPLTDKFALGFYASLGGGFLKERNYYSKYDNMFYVVKFSTGILMEIGDLKKQPFILGISPLSGFAFVDMDYIKPLEVRFGRMFSNKWYVMGEFVYGFSLADETVYIEPSIHVGYNFGYKPRKKKSAQL